MIPDKGQWIAFRMLGTAFTKQRLIDTSDIMPPAQGWQHLMNEKDFTK
jgi:hypothetical protein